MRRLVRPALLLTVASMFGVGCGTTAGTSGGAVPSSVAEGPAPAPTDTIDTTTTPIVRSGREAATAELATARTRWTAAALHGYAITYQHASMAVYGRYRVHVTQDRYRFAEAIEDPQSAVRVGPPVDLVFDSGAIDPTIDGAFRTIERALREAGSINVSFDDTFGFPTHADIDWITDAIDDEESFGLADLQPESLPELTAEQQRLHLELASARLRWRAAQLFDYTFDEAVGCECSGGQWSVRVSHGVATVTAPTGDDPAALATGFVVGTIDELLAATDRTIQLGGNVLATYDPADGHPAQLTLDPLPNAVDDEVTYTITRFQARTPAG